MIRKLTARVDVLRNGVKLTELQFSDAPSIYADKTAKIKSSLRGTFKYNPLVNYFKDVLNPVVTIDGIEYSLGRFYIGSKSTMYDDNLQCLGTIEAYDGCFILSQRKTEALLHIAGGSSYINTIDQLLTECGIVQKIITPSALTITNDREDWEIGTEYLTIVNELLAEINYKDIWFNADGYAMIEPQSQPSAENIKHTYDATSEASITLPFCKQETDIFGKPNVFVAVVSNADMSAPLTATAENNNPQSPLSIISRGIRIPQIYKVRNIASQEELQKYVDNLRNETMFETETIEIRTALEPNHGIGDTIAVNKPPISPALYEEQSWDLTLGVGKFMTIKAKKAIPTASTTNEDKPYTGSLNEATAEQIEQVASEDRAQDIWSIGDETAPITLNNGEDIILQIADFNHDDLSDGSGKAKITFVMKNCFNTEKEINTFGSNRGGWEGSYFRSDYIPEYMNLLPDDWRIIIKQVTKKTQAGNKSSTIVNTEDYLWLLSYTELGFLTDPMYSPGGEGIQYPVFPDKASRIKYVGNTARWWWLRSPRLDNGSYFMNVRGSGSSDSAPADYTYGICLGLCV